jgi:hypothetical protein
MLDCELDFSNLHAVGIGSDATISARIRLQVSVICMVWFGRQLL